MFHPVLYKEKCLFAHGMTNSSINIGEQFGTLVSKSSNLLEKSLYVYVSLSWTDPSVQCLTLQLDNDALFLITSTERKFSS